jgi:hypothetical protein
MEIRKKSQIMKLIFLVIGLTIILIIITFWKQVLGPSIFPLITIKDIYQGKIEENFSTTLYGEKVEKVFPATLYGTVVLANGDTAVLEDDGYAIEIGAMKQSPGFPPDIELNLKKNQRVLVSGLVFKYPEEGYVGFAANYTKLIDDTAQITSPLEVNLSFINILNQGKWVTLKNQTLLKSITDRKFDFGYTAWTHVLCKRPLEIIVGKNYNLVGFVAYFNGPEIFVVGVEQLGGK